MMKEKCRFVWHCRCGQKAYKMYLEKINNEIYIKLNHAKMALEYINNYFIIFNIT